MIGIKPQKKGLFGKGIDLVNGPPIVAQESPQDMPVGMGFEPKQEPGWKRALVAALGGAVDGAAQYYGGQPLIAQDMMLRQHQQQQAAQAQMQRAQELADYRTKKGIDAEFREAPAPDTFEKALIGAGIDPSSEQARELYRRRADSMAQGQDEFVVVPIPGRGTYAGPKSGLPGALGQGVSAPVGKLTPIGGGTAGNGGGNFPAR